MTDQLHTHSHDHSHSHEHPDDHEHQHDHSHLRTATPGHEYGPTAEGSVVLDIGGDIGALVLITPPELLGAEIEVSLVGNNGHRTHVAVRERRTPAGTQYAAIYPSLIQGEYTVWSVDGRAAGLVTVEGAHVAQLDWTKAHSA